MKKAIPRILALWFVAALVLGLAKPANSGQKAPDGQPAPAAAPQALAPTPVFRYPVVPGVVISGYFDHSKASGTVTWYNGMQNSSPSYGFYFSCSTPYMYDFVGCADNQSGEPACPNSREVWYDGHHGVDYEYAANWHTGAVCNPDLFEGITMPIYAPADGWVQFAGYDASRPANGWHIRIKHDLNGNGSFDDDGFRSNYLHFAEGELAVATNQMVSEGDLLGLGGSTGYSSSPHLHFEVQRSSDNFTTSLWQVDPYGWSGPEDDPWPYENTVLWRYDFSHQFYLPAAVFEYSPECPSCGEQLRNNGFEEGHTYWGENGVDVIASTSHPLLPVAPYAGSWLGWLGGRDDAADVLYQLIEVPQGLSGAHLSYYVMMTTAEDGGIYDRFFVRLRTGAGDLIQELDYLDNTFLPANRWVLREIDIPALTGRQGEQLRISLEATTDSNTITNFYVDEVYLEALSP